MARIKEEELKDIPHVEFEGQKYYAVKETAQALNADLKGIEAIKLPIVGVYTEVATFDAIIAAKEANRKLSEFDKNIIKAINYNPKEKK
ncbi:MAG: hypothetical protein DI539_00830 [Flavobacterium psychrophilum]|nr:MAG: hypothetical protein DI539_00830 [Flavobacterium psychrophilum]